LLSNKLSNSNNNLNQDEQTELSRRKLLWFLYLVRPPFFENILCKLLTKLTPNFVLNKTKKLSGGLSTMVKGYRDIYFYTAGSD